MLILHIPTLILCITTLIPRIPCIHNLIPCIFPLVPHIPTLITHIPTLIPRIPTLIPFVSIISLIPFTNSPFQLLHIAKSMCRTGEIIAQIGFSNCSAEHLCMASSYVRNLKTLKAHS